MSAIELKDYRLLLMSEPDFQYVPLMRKLGDLGFNHANVHVITSSSSMVHMVRRSFTVGIVSEKFSTNPPEGLHAIPLSDPDLKWHFYMLYRLKAGNARAVTKLAHDIRALFDVDGGCGDVR